mmetsp:Transcript_17984/g.29177  ORF Transcript_17984/g.29177 Transcript_17984/m.29177 type:complete len:270 (-) Transcript_17984:1265-2074(-)
MIVVGMVSDLGRRPLLGQIKTCLQVAKIARRRLLRDMSRRQELSRLWMFEYSRFECFRQWETYVGRAGKSKLAEGLGEVYCASYRMKAARGLNILVLDGGKEYPLRVVLVRLRGDGGLLHLSSADIRWGNKVNQVLQQRIGLISANAYISTLGGGHFLCKQIDKAETMAYHQLKVATRLGDHVLACQCRIHLCYNLLQRGKFSQARFCLLREWIVAHILKNSLLKSMVRSAWLYRNRLLRMKHELAKHTSKKNDQHLKDPYYRQRIIRE